MKKNLLIFIHWQDHLIDQRQKINRTVIVIVACGDETTKHRLLLVVFFLLLILDFISLKWKKKIWISSLNDQQLVIFHSKKFLFYVSKNKIFVFYSKIIIITIIKKWINKSNEKNWPIYWLFVCVCVCETGNDLYVQWEREKKKH